VKLVGGGNRFNSVTPFYSKLKIPKLSDLNKIEIAKFVHNCIYNNLPPSFSGYFLNTCEHSLRTTRLSLNENNLHIPRYTTSRLKRSIKYQGVIIWNSTTKEIQKLTTKTFKSKL